MPEVKTYIKEQVKLLAFRTVNDSDSLIRTKTLDSIVVVDLAVSLEERYGIKIPFNDINEENFDTVELIANYLAKKGVSSGN